MEQEKTVNWTPIGDCQAIWRRHPAPKDPRNPQPEGALWVPPSEQEHVRAKWARIKAGAES